MMWNPETTPNFSRSEMSCKCGQCDSECKMQQGFMYMLQVMRNDLGPMTVNSGYRCRLHPDEAKKDAPGSHAQGLAADIAVSGAHGRFEIIESAFQVGMVGIGQANSFIHVDAGHAHYSRPAMWKYG